MLTTGRRLTLFLWLFIFLPPLTAQDSLLYQRITIRDTLCTVEHALRIIEKQTRLSFSYNTGLINKKKTILLSARQEKLIDILREITDDAGLEYSIIGRHLVIYRPVRTRSINPESKIDSVYFFEIRGRVLDRKDGLPLPFSSIYLRGKSIGTISNEEGEFLLKLSSSEIGETLVVSSIGYKDFASPVASLVNSNTDYVLKPDVVSIQEVIIRKIDPVSLLQNASGSIRRNYPQHPAVLTSFYRETVKRGNRYLTVSEAVLENFKSSYTGLGTDQVKILKGRKSDDLDRQDTIMLKLKAGLGTMLLLDVVQNRPEFLTPESLNDYNFKLADIVIDEGRDYYAVEFSPRSGSDAIYAGRIIIDTRDMAFRWVEFYISPERLAQATKLFIVKKPAKLVVRVLNAQYKVAFRKSGSKYYLNLIQAETEFRIRKRRQLTGSTYGTKLEMVVTDIDTLNADRFPQRQTARLNEFFSDQLGAYDETFWGEYNFITPEESLEQAIIRLQRAQAEKKEESGQEQHNSNN
ncbi:MAG: carboxypeptidase-like regulatory domain-containing protein [Bacteroidales bacterium]|nr:carboxypeptidase-like regulatory domain-containing protein [Bacteroidales bacterium]